MSGARLLAGLDHPLPETVAVGGGTALFACGWCFSPQARVARLAFAVDGEEQPVRFHGMPRKDVLHAYRDSDDDPLAHSFRSGFWGMVRLRPRADRAERVIELRATLEGGGEASAELARVTIAGPAQPLELAAPEPGAGPLVAIAMATFNPPPELFRRQVESIRAQTHRNWLCVVSDDCSSAVAVAAMEEAIGGDPRFAISRAPRRLHFYRNFERALALCPAGADYVAMADQDDEWHSGKLEALLGVIGDAQLVYSDARIVSPDGKALAETYWGERRNNHTDIESLLVANSITGAASLFPRRLLDDALPFPPRQFSHFHDHWVGLVARALGEIRFVDRPLYDYIQHGSAVLGHANANWMPRFAERARGWRHKDPRERVRKWRLHYFVDCCRLMQFTAVLEMRLGERMSRRTRRALTRFARADGELLPLADLARRAAGEFVGKPETLGAELALFFAFVWRRALSAVARERPNRFLRLDALPPETLLPKPGQRDPGVASIGTVGAKIAPLELSLRDDGPQRVNLLIPTIDLEHFFGGYIAKLNLAARLAERGARVRIVTVDPVPTLPSSWRSQLESYSGLADLFDRVEVVFGRESAGVDVSPADRFVATTWWTAHIANNAARSVGGERFLYLIQEHEPFTFPMGTFAALAADSYRLPHRALFSSELLRDYFRRHGIGVFAAGDEHGERDSAAFENAITAVSPPTAAELAARTTRRLLFYARPEPHAARNMFELGALALTRAAEQGAFGPGWELRGIGTVTREQRLHLGHGVSLDLLPRTHQDRYAEVLRDHDVGLALMYTPHPSLVPIEMASAGMLTVTNTFENKTAAALREISPNLLAAEPSLDGIAAALCEATAAVEQVERRAAGSHVSWSRDWRSSFDDAVMEQVEEFLGVGAPSARLA